jgi:hypothetical protein
MLCKNQGALKINTLSANQTGLPILNAEIKFKNKNLAARILLDSGSEVTVVTNKYITSNKLQKN